MCIVAFFVVLCVLESEFIFSLLHLSFMTYHTCNLVPRFRRHGRFGEGASHYVCMLDRVSSNSSFPRGFLSVLNFHLQCSDFLARPEFPESGSVIVLSFFLHSFFFFLPIVRVGWGGGFVLRSLFTRPLRRLFCRVSVPVLTLIVAAAFLFISQFLFVSSPSARLLRLCALFNQTWYISQSTAPRHGDWTISSEPSPLPSCFYYFISFRLASHPTSPMRPRKSMHP
ncbi:hypothetical protein R3P38DRAFT_1345717 [Favolaschia claudopus]|uniref:Uncharacterized protein n=1 Tax=Favolaschia claudopus TaxID=2862362 RepID=A0AAW0DT06_9AGAR